MLLEKGEKIQEGDEYYQNQDNKWIKSNNINSTVYGLTIYRRKIDKKDSEYIYLKPGEIKQKDDEISTNNGLTWKKSNGKGLIPIYRRKKEKPFPKYMQLAGEDLIIYFTTYRNGIVVQTDRGWNLFDQCTNMNMTGFVDVDCEIKIKE
jgi:hypothetical protein